MKKASSYQYIIFGLGNPGAEYDDTRHNAGRNAVRLYAEHENYPEFIEEKHKKFLISEKHDKKQSSLLILPNTYMNKSGESLWALKIPNKKQISNKLIVLHDDLDLPIGTVKLVKNRGTAGHKGVESVVRTAGTRDFVRIRIGIAKPTDLMKSQTRNVVHTIVIGKLSPREKTLLKQGVTEASKALDTLLTHGLAPAMNEHNKRS